MLQRSIADEHLSSFTVRSIVEGVGTYSDHVSVSLAPSEDDILNHFYLERIECTPFQHHRHASSCYSLQFPLRLLSIYSGVNCVCIEARGT